MDKKLLRFVDLDELKCLEEDAEDDVRDANQQLILVRTMVNKQDVIKPKHTYHSDREYQAREVPNVDDLLHYNNDNDGGEEQGEDGIDYDEEDDDDLEASVIVVPEKYQKLLPTHHHTPSEVV